jgi:signal transduction histidine kinase
VINQAEQHPLYNDLEAQSWNIKAAAAYPLKLADHVLGVLNISLDDRETFREAELRIVQLLADQAAIALENARLYQSIADNETRLSHLVQQLAHVQEEERRLVGLDLHDGLTQILLSTNMHLNSFAALAKDGINGQAQAEFGLVRTRLKEAIEEARWVVSELRPTELEDYGLVDALRMYVNKVSEVENWQVEFSADLEKITLSPIVETALFRITQEAINNVRKHAHTSKILVLLKNESDCITLKIQDWGCGFNLAGISVENQQLGLIGMRERATLIDGELEIESQPDQGTIVRAKFLSAGND